MTTPVAPFYQLKCSCNQYTWGKQGSNSLAARLCAKTPGWDGDGPSKDFRVDEKTPYAEMWMGTYPVLPSYVSDTSEDLQRVLDRHPKELLGDTVVSKFGHYKLPYLPKILSIAKALPLQVHPNKSFSSKKHQENPKSFNDDNHKPEIALALTEFEAFCGFKPLHAISELLCLEPLMKFLVAGDSIRGKFTSSDLREVVRAILESSDDTIKSAVKGLISLPETAFTNANKHIPQLAPRLVDDFAPTDPGILVGLVAMNYLKLRPGDCIYIPAGGIHAYIAGDIIECMARSDNVLNTGFCPRAERDNAEEFCSVVDFEPYDASRAIVKPTKYWRSEGGKTKVFQPPTSEFNMLETMLQPGERETLGKGGPSIVLVTRGSASSLMGGQEVQLREGYVFFVAQGIGMTIEAGKDGLCLHTAYVD